MNGYAKIPALPVVSNVPLDGKFLVTDAVRHGWTVDAVYVNGTAKLAGDATYPWSSTQTADALGYPVLLVDFTSGAATWADNDAVHVSVSAPSANRQGVIEVIRTLLEGSTEFGRFGLNADLFSEAAARMPPFVPKVLINASGERAAKVLPWIESELLQSFPMISMAYEGRGIGPVVVDRRRGPKDGRLVLGQMPVVQRRGDVQESPKSDVFNRFELRYNYDILTDTYASVKRRNERNSAICRLSQSPDMAGRICEMPPIESPYIDDANLADFVLDWLAAHYALPSYFVEYECLPWAFFRYRRGMNIALTDERLGIVDLNATIVSTSYARGQPSVLGLRVWHPFWEQSFSGKV